MNDHLRGIKTEPPDDTSTDLRMVAHPVRWLPDPDEIRDAESRHHRRVLEKLGERHLAPLGLNIWELICEVQENCPEIREEFQKSIHQNRRKPYIEINDWTTHNDVVNGFRLIRQARPPRPIEGAPKRDPLVAVQCALHHDRRGWSYEQIAAIYDWTESRVGAHIKLGREILGATN